MFMEAYMAITLSLQQTILTSFLLIGWCMVDMRNLLSLYPKTTKQKLVDGIVVHLSGEEHLKLKVLGHLI